MEEEVINRIGANNILSSPPFATADARSFITQLLDGMVQRNPVPQTLQDLFDEQGAPLQCYPFTDEAFESFIQHHSIGTVESNPQELLNNLERAAQRAITLNRRLIDLDVLTQVINGI